MTHETHEISAKNIKTIAPQFPLGKPVCPNHGCVGWILAWQKSQGARYITGTVSGDRSSASPLGPVGLVSPMATSTSTGTSTSPKLQQMKRNDNQLYRSDSKLVVVASSRGLTPPERQRPQLRHLCKRAAHCNALPPVWRPAGKL